MDDREEFTQESLRRKALDCDVPDYMIDGHINYIVHRLEPGHFLMNVYSNDLFGAMERADMTNQRRIFEHVKFIYNHAPTGCWGSKEAAANWLKDRSDEQAS